MFQGDIEENVGGCFFFEHKVTLFIKRYCWWTCNRCKGEIVFVGRHWTVYRWCVVQYITLSTKTGNSSTNSHLNIESLIIYRFVCFLTFELSSERDKNTVWGLDKAAWLKWLLVQWMIHICSCSLYLGSKGCCIIVTWWGGPGEIESYLDN